MRWTQKLCCLRWTWKLYVLPAYCCLLVLYHLNWLYRISDFFELATKTKHETPQLEQFKGQHYDVCVVGAGLSGSVLAERYANVLNQSVLVLEKRDHIAGNCYDYVDEETGLLVSKYGAHLFHTEKTKVWDYMTRFGKWINYELRVRGLVNGKYVPIPVNIETVNTLFDLKIANPKQMKKWLESEQVKVKGRPYANSEEVALARVGPRLYDLIFRSYTYKKWAKMPAQLGPEVLSRIHVHSDDDDRYFADPFQAVPKDGYTSIVRNMLASENIHVYVGVDYFQVRNYTSCGRTYYTGPIDTYFADTGWPKLEYRSLTFERVVAAPKVTMRDVVTGKEDYFFQQAFVVNHPQNDTDFTRIVEYKHLPNQPEQPPEKKKKSVYFVERSTDKGEPYYPVSNYENEALYKKYQALASAETNITFVGRLANYKYFNMDAAVENALTVFEEQTREQRKCTPGSFVSAKHWLSLFPGGEKGLGLKQKAVVFIPVGKQAIAYVDQLVRKAGTEHFHFILMRYNNHSWANMNWYDSVEWMDQDDSGTCWIQAKKALTPVKVAPYSHVCRWDDDLSPTEDFHGAILLQWMQQLNLGISQPMIRKNPHPYYKGTATTDRPEIAQLNEVKFVEVMAPCYARDLWVHCIWPRMFNNSSTGWGIDTVLHRTLCAPNRVHSIRMPLDHNDQKLLKKDTGRKELKRMERANLDNRWGERIYPDTLQSFSIHVDESCKLGLQVV